MASNTELAPSEPLHPSSALPNGDNPADLEQVGPRFMGLLGGSAGRLLACPGLPRPQSVSLFPVQGKSYQFSSLPFGLSTATRTFTRLVRAVAASLRKEGVQFFVYLDDWLVVARTREDLTSDVPEGHGCRVLSGVSHQSGQVMPCALPAHYISGRYPGFPTGEGLSDTGEGGGGLRRRGLAQVVEGAVLAGPVRTPGESSELVPFARMNMRPLQFHLVAFFRPASRDLTIPIAPAPHLEETFRWWCHAANLTRGVPFPPAPPSLVLTTDSSLRGWGAYTKAASLAHVWKRVSGERTSMCWSYWQCTGRCAFSARRRTAV